MENWDEHIKKKLNDARYLIENPEMAINRLKNDIRKAANDVKGMFKVDK